MKSLFQKYQVFITNLFMMACMLGSCFSAVIYIQDAPNKAIATLAQTVKDNDITLDQRITSESIARSLEVTGIKSDMRTEASSIRAFVRTEIDDVKKILERIEQRQYDQRKRAEAPGFVPFGG